MFGSIYSATILFVTAQAAWAQDTVAEQLRAQWESSRRQMVHIADAMPPEKFDFRPTPEVRSFREIVAHFAGEGMTWMEMLAGKMPESAEQFEQLNQRFGGLETKADILKALSDSYDYGAKVLADGPMTATA